MRQYLQIHVIQPLHGTGEPDHNHTSAADNTSKHNKGNLLYMGFEADELVTFFNFSCDDVDPVVKEMEEGYDE